MSKRSECFRFEVFNWHFSRLGRSYLEKARRVLWCKKLLLVWMQFARKKCYDTEEEFCHKSIYKQLYWLQEQNVVWMADHFMDHSWGDKVVHWQHSSNLRLCYVGFKLGFQIGVGKILRFIKTLCHYNCVRSQPNGGQRHNCGSSVAQNDYFQSLLCENQTCFLIYNEEKWIQYIMHKNEK